LNTQSNGSELQYKPGDHIGILASNRKELVDSILNKVTNAPSPDQLVRVEVLKEKTNVFGVVKQWVKDDRYPNEITLRTAFTNFLDITSPPSQKLLSYLSLQASDETDRLNLEKLAKDHLAYEEWKLDGYPNLVEVLEEFSSVKPNVTLLLTQLPKLQARFYSISSSPKATDSIDLTLGVVEYKVKDKTVHYGVCSKWLDEMNVGDTVPVFIREYVLIYLANFFIEILIYFI
jgi:nitric-oxide synthase, brain